MVFSIAAIAFATLLISPGLLFVPCCGSRPYPFCEIVLVSANECDSTAVLFSGEIHPNAATLMVFVALLVRFDANLLSHSSLHLTD